MRTQDKSAASLARSTSYLVILTGDAYDDHFLCGVRNLRVMIEDTKNVSDASWFTPTFPNHGLLPRASGCWYAVC